MIEWYWFVAWWFIAPLAVLWMWWRSDKAQESKIAGLTIQLGHLRADLLTEQGLQRVAEASEQHALKTLRGLYGAGSKAPASINALSLLFYDRSKQAGQWPMPPRLGPNELLAAPFPTDTWVSAQLMRMTSELGEAFEAMRDSSDRGMFLGPDGKPEGFVVEVADCIIIGMGLCAGLGLDLEAAMLAKHRYNCTRPAKHGRRF